MAYEYNRFLFQIGSIRRARLSGQIKSPSRFYSRLVRLEVNKEQKEAVEYTEFLFQIGSIRRITAIVITSPDPSFYSRLVRLEVRNRTGNTLSGSWVSIPDWFD